MRRWWLSLLVGYAVAMTLLAARSASQAMVYRYIYHQGLNDFYTRPANVDGEITEAFSTTVEHLHFTNSIGPLYPVAQTLGLIDGWTILAVALILAVISQLWISSRRPVFSITTSNTKD